MSKLSSSNGQTQRPVGSKESVATKSQRNIAFYSKPFKVRSLHYARELRYENGECRWGFQVDDYGLRHQWFKLDLDPSQSRGISDLSRQYPDQHALPPGYSASSEKLCTDYLRALRIHTEEVLQHKLPASILKTTPIEYMITVPAVWSDSAQAKTRSCALNAGMDKDLQIISEPEAAAIYALHAMYPHSIQIGDTFVLCVGLQGGQV